ncbi:MAG: flagellar motor protein MotA, partial [Gemmatimonadetes bacterium]|nr:flagellar motor protein MotA [Gemmatimonadota bacterium]NIT68618.1 flagellar motor protein MotA [Gemmatimonadota bacterium]NIW77334.1 flagellar motor protein MotA [Gemmatimonadota bacterium]NIY37195.1 flagellar motor protein MotA [Gemmatimonadota bacterium]
AVTTVCFSIPEIVRTQRVILNAIFPTTQDASTAAITMLQLAEKARKKGVLSLQDILPKLESEPFLYKSVSMLVDG